ncbi:MAG: hypothetical protein WBE41_08805 [Terracidiphilus sp.]
MDEGTANQSQFNSLLWAALYHHDSIESLKRYFSPGLPDSISWIDTFPGPRIAVSLADYAKEASLRSSLAILTSIEATFKRDYRFRCEERLKDTLSRAFREIHKGKPDYRSVSLERDIFDTWSRNVPDANRLIGDLRSAFRFRNWLAHGRYWIPRLGRNYDFEYLYRLADAVYSSLPLCGMDDA